MALESGPPLFRESSRDISHASFERCHEAHLRDDLGADWLDRLELMIAIEDHVAGIEIADVVVDQIDAVGDLMRVIESVQNGMARAPRGGGMAQR